MSFRRDRSRRAEEARRMARRWVEVGRERRTQADICPAPDQSSRLAYPDRIAKNRGDGRVPVGERPRRQPSSRHRRWRVSHSWPSPKSPAARPQGRIVLAAPISLGAIETALRRADRGARRGHLRAAKRQRCAAARAARSARSRWPSARCRSLPTKQARASWPTALYGSASTGCPGPRRCRSGATG